MTNRTYCQYNIEQYPEYAFEDYLRTKFLDLVDPKAQFSVHHRTKRVYVRSSSKVDFFVLAAIKNDCIPYSVITLDSEIEYP